MKKLCLITVLLATVLATVAHAFAANEASIRYFILTAATSPHNTESLTNAYENLHHGFPVTGSDAVKTNPGALNTPRIFRACDIVSSPAGYAMWDGTNNPASPFSSENGKRLGIGVDWKSTNRFLASDIYFALHSSDAANSFSYSGNLATNNSGALLSFSRATLVGEQWDAAGNVIATFTTGLATNPVNRILALLRLSWVCSNTNTLALTLQYFKQHLPFTSHASFYTLDTNGVVAKEFTSQIESRSHLNATPARIFLEGQRNVPEFSYTLEGTDDFLSWHDVVSGMTDGASYPNSGAWRFFRTREDNLSVASGKSRYVVQWQIVNGPE